MGEKKFCHLHLHTEYSLLDASDKIPELIKRAKELGMEICNSSKEDLKEKALANKPGLRRQYVNIPVGDEEYGFRISGIGAKAIKLEKYVKYDEIFEALEAGNENGLEAMVKQIIEDYEEENEEEAE